MSQGIAISNPQSTQNITPPPRSFRAKAGAGLRLIAVNFLVFAVTAELASIVLVHLKKWPSARPTYHLTNYKFWTDTNPDFGIWHRPSGHFLHQEGCFSLQLSTNSYGARDVERSLRANRPRTVVLGDSIVEGFGVSDDQRLTNLLEKRTGREHLNFGSGGGFSPLQYALVYRTLASDFDHDRVVVGVLPDNDFREMDKNWLELAYPGQYRPYYKDDLSIGYLGTYRARENDSWWERIKAVMRAYLASYHVGQYIAVTWLAPHRSYSGYNDFSDTDMKRLENALLDIKRTADTHHATMSVFLVPRPADFEHAKKGSNRLGPVLEKWGRANGIPVKDLLPEMDTRTHGDFHKLILPCDTHWSAYGNALAADILQPWIYGKE